MATFTRPPENSIQRRVEQRRKWFGLLRGFVIFPGMLVAGVMVLASLVWPPVPAVETGGHTRHYEDLRTQAVHASPEAVVDALRSITESDPRFTLREVVPPSASSHEARIELIAHARIPGFDTHLSARAVPGEDGTTSIHLRATSVRGGGKTDLGTKARAITQLQQRLREYFTRD